MSGLGAAGFGDGLRDGRLRGGVCGGRCASRRGSRFGNRRRRFGVEVAVAVEEDGREEHQEEQHLLEPQEPRLEETAQDARHLPPGRQLFQGLPRRPGGHRPAEQPGPGRTPSRRPLGRLPGDPRGINKKITVEVIHRLAGFVELPPFLDEPAPAVCRQLRRGGRCSLRGHVLGFRLLVLDRLGFGLAEDPDEPPQDLFRPTLPPPRQVVRPLQARRQTQSQRPRRLARRAFLSTRRVDHVHRPGVPAGPQRRPRRQARRPPAGQLELHHLGRPAPAAGRPAVPQGDQRVTVPHEVRPAVGVAPAALGLLPAQNPPPRHVRRPRAALQRDDERLHPVSAPTHARIRRSASASSAVRSAPPWPPNEVLAA